MHVTKLGGHDFYLTATPHRRQVTDQHPMDGKATKKTPCRRALLKDHLKRSSNKRQGKIWKILASQWKQVDAAIAGFWLNRIHLFLVL